MLKRRKKTESPVGRRPVTNRPVAPVFSYRAKRSDNNTNLGRGQEPPVKASQRTLPGRGWWNNIPAGAAIVVILGCLLYATLLTSHAKVVIQDRPGAREELRTMDIYQRAAQQELGGLLNHSKLTINPDKVARKIQSRFPELRTVTVTIPLIGKRPVVTLEPVQPALVIRGNGGSYVIDADGQAIAKTSELPQVSKTLMTVSDQSGLAIQTGHRILPEENVAFITTFVQQLQAQKVKTSALILPAVPEEFDVRVDGQPYVIKTNLTGDARLQAGMYLASKAKFEADKTQPSEVVDTRVEERVYYK